MTAFSNSRNLAALSWKSQEPCIRLKYGVKLVNAKAETIFNYTGLENVESWTGRLIQIVESSDLDDEENAATGNKFCSGDVLFGKLRPYLAKAFVAEVDGCCTSELLVLRPIKYDSNYLKYLLLTPDFINLVNSSTYGAKMPRASWDFIGNISLPTLPLEAQKSIARFLDRKTAEIDTLIAKKQRLIQLLEEKRTALINQAVTKGLNPNAPMKDSGIPWIGEIPEHWEIIKIKHLLEEIVDTEHKTATFYPDGKYLVVRTSNVRQGQLILKDAKYTDLDGFTEWTKRGKPQPGDILFTREAPPGEACIVPHDLDLCLGQRMVLFRIKPELLNGDFGVYSLYAGLANEFIKSLSQGSTVSHFNMSDIGNIPILTPPIEEQQLVVNHLKEIILRISLLVEKTISATEKLQEYRRSLITAAVTGKLAIEEEDAA